MVSTVPKVSPAMMVTDIPVSGGFRCLPSEAGVSCGGDHSPRGDAAAAGRLLDRDGRDHHGRLTLWDDPHHDPRAGALRGSFPNSISRVSQI